MSERKRGGCVADMIGCVADMIGCVGDTNGILGVRSRYSPLILRTVQGNQRYKRPPFSLLPSRP